MRFFMNCPLNGPDDARFVKQFEHLQSVVCQRRDAPAVRAGDFFNRRAMRALLIGPTLMAVNQFSGTFIIITYAASIFKDSSSDFDPHTSAMVVGGLQIVGTYVTSLCIDRLGRRVLLVASASGTALGLGMMVAYLQLQSGQCDVSALRLVPVISLSFVTVVASMGLGSVPYVIIAEVLPQRVGSMCMDMVRFNIRIYM